MKGREGSPPQAGAFGTGVTSGSEMNVNAEEAVFDEEKMDITMDELREFLEADYLEVRADPGFKERLRRKLWDLVKSKRGRI